MSSSLVQCPVCGAFGEPGAFCEMGCGRLPKAAPAPSPAAEPRGLSPRLVATLPAQFNEGATERVAFAYGLGADLFERLELAVKDGDQVLGKALTDGRPGERGELHVNVPARSSGHLALTVELTGRLVGEDEAFLFRGDLQIAVKPRPASVNFSPTINLSGNYGNDFAGARIGNLTLPGENFSTADGASVNQTVELKPVRTPCRLLLTCPDESLQVFAAEQITLGRSRGNDVVLRAFDGSGVAQDDISRRISGTHARLCVGASGIELRDGGSHPSTNGTFVDGMQLPAGGRKAFRTGSAEIGFGPGTEALKLKLAVHNDAWGRPTGCMLARTDGARRRTGIVLRELVLDDGGTRLVWDGARFMLRAAGGQTALLPGCAVEFEGRRWRVEPYRPTWIHSISD